MEALADLVLCLAKCGCDGGSKHRRVDVATGSEEQLGRPRSAGLSSASSLIFWLGHDCVHGMSMLDGYFFEKRKAPRVLRVTMSCQSSKRRNRNDRRLNGQIIASKLV